MVVKIVGLGLIGGSLAMALSREKTVRVVGADKDALTLCTALEKGAIHAMEEIDFARQEEADVVFVCLPPAAAVHYIENQNFRHNCLVCDFCGVKRVMQTAAKNAQNKSTFEYIGAHPMAGKEKQGFANADADLFVGASLILCAEKEDENAARLIEAVKPAGFKKFVFTTPEKHDETIAFTSQLAHIVSNAYIKNSKERVDGFTGGSFEDMTRVAYLDSGLWTQLFFENADYLGESIDKLIADLTKYRVALTTNDKDKMRLLLEEGKQIKENAKKETK